MLHARSHSGTAAVNFWSDVRAYERGSTDVDNPPDTRQKASLSDYLAAERTLLAWIRTGLALMGFGFVVARFGLFLQQLQIMQRTPKASSFEV